MGFFYIKKVLYICFMEDKSKEKIYVDTIIYQRHKGFPFQWLDIKHIEFEDEDVIRLDYIEPYYSDNDSYDGHFSGMVIRKVEETDEQYNNRQERIAQDEKWAKERRYQSYLRLKKEFENEIDKSNIQG
jgi:hypothetical protein